MAVTATFEDRLGNVDKGKIVIDIVNDIPGPATAKIFWGVTGPNSVLKVFDLLSPPDFTGVAASALNTVMVNLITLGTIYEQGNYRVQVRVIDEADDSTFISYDEVYSYSPFDSCGDVVDQKFSETVYCDAKALVIKDDTLYLPYTRSGTITIKHPDIPGVTTPVDTVSTDTLVNIPITYRNVSYTVTYAITFSVSITVNNIIFIEQHSLDKQVSVPITCVSICDIETCIDDELRSLDTKAKNVAGVHNMGVQDQDKWMLLNSYIAGYNQAALCFNTEGKDYYYNKIKGLLTCLGDCCDDGKIEEIKPSGELVFIQGAAGVDGRTILNGNGVPTTEGSDGDYYIDNVTVRLYGPKIGGLWSFSILLPGADGADGRTILNGNGVPGSGLGLDGDYYIDNDGPTIYGPKTAGAWGSGTAMTGGGGTTTAWVPFTTNLQFPWVTFPSTSVDLEWRRNGNNYEMKGSVQYNGADPGTTEVPFLDKLWLLSGTTLPVSAIHGYFTDDTDGTIVGIVQESVTNSTNLIWVKPLAGLTPSTTYRIRLITGIDE